jgi:hypothetical protein
VRVKRFVIAVACVIAAFALTATPAVAKMHKPGAIPQVRCGVGQFSTWDADKKGRLVPVCVSTMPSSGSVNYGFATGYVPDCPPGKIAYVGTYVPDMLAHVAEVRASAECKKK